MATETRTKYMANAWGSIALYFALFSMFMLPGHLEHWLAILQASVVLSFFAAILNEILQQVKKLNGNSSPTFAGRPEPVTINMTNEDGSPLTQEQLDHLVRVKRAGLVGTGENDALASNVTTRNPGRG